MEVKHYELSLDVDFEHETYKGQEAIQMTSDGEIVLNSTGINIRSISVDGKNVNFSSRGEDEVVLEGQHHGNVKIGVSFDADVSKTLMGFYVARDPDGSKMLTTQFESTGARMAFPCFDNPAYKAEFSLTLTVDNDLDAISNMPVERSDKTGNRKKIIFRKTPRMSTYLLYFGIGRFDEIKEKHGDVEIILAANKGHLNSDNFPIEMASACIDYYNSYFEIKYPLPKMHLIAVPEFGAGAMENWGAITFREVRILHNKSSTESSKRDIASVIAHEITHQWFGDLVTMKWWNDLWLNESFATFMSYKPIDKLFPEWDQIGDMIISRSSSAFVGDSLINSHPIDADVKDPESVAQIFDEISYGKGGAVLRMIEAYLGPESFRKGLSEHLKNHAYSNATGQDLWSSLEKVSGKPVSNIMSVWMRKTGYPVVHAERHGNIIHLRQERFLLSGNREGETWPIPLTVKRKNGTESIVMDRQEMDIPSEGFVKLNPEETGFYRVHYHGELMDEIMKSSNTMGKYDAIGIISNLYAFMLSGSITLKDLIQNLQKFHGRSERTVIEELLSVYRGLLAVHGDNNVVSASALSYARQLYDWINSGKLKNSDAIIIKESVYSLLAVLDDELSLQLSEKFDNLFNEEPEIRSAISIAYARKKGDVHEMIGKMQTASTDDDRLAILGGMGYLPGKANMEEVLSLMRNGKIKKQDYSTYINAICSYRNNRKVAIEGYDQMIDILETVNRKSGLTGRIIYATAPALLLENEAEMRKILDSKKKSSTEIGIKKALEIYDVYRKSIRREIRS